MKSSHLVNWALSSVSAVAKSERVLGLPVHLTIEPTNICNLHCPVCETGAGMIRRPKGFMDYDAYCRIIDSMPQVNTLLLYYMGEPMLHQRIYDMIKYAVDRGIYVSICTNGETVDADALVNSGLQEVNFQIGGLTQETHEQYRRGGNWRRTMSNLRDVLDLRREKMKVTVGFIVMKHNEHEVAALHKLQDMGVDTVQVINPCVRTIEQGKQFMPTDDKYWYYDRPAFDRGVLKPRVIPQNRCWWIYYSSVITWQGDVVPCCRDAQGDYVMGNVLAEDFSRIWNGEKYRKFRHQLATTQHYLTLCKLCSGYSIARLY